jgi:hypothetical protein
MSDRRTRRLRVALGVPGVIALSVISFVARGGASHPGYVPDPVTMAAEDRSANYSSLRVERTFEEPAGEVEWTVVSYEASDGPCLDIYAEAVPGDDEAKMSSCGRFEGPFRWSIGGVEVADQFYNVAFGRAAVGADRMRITLGHGAAVAPDVVRGIWVAVMPGSPEDFDITLLEAVGGNGRVLESVRPTSIADLRENAEDTETHSGAR